MKLTKGQRAILKRMVENKDLFDGELVYEKGNCFIGYDRVDCRIFWGLLRHMAISQDQYSEIGELERYHINSTGEELLKETQNGNS